MRVQRGQAVQVFRAQPSSGGYTVSPGVLCATQGIPVLQRGACCATMREPVRPKGSFLRCSQA